MNKPGLQNIVSDSNLSLRGLWFDEVWPLSEQTWGLVSLLDKAEQWDYLEARHECSPVGSDNLKAADLEKGVVVGVCV